MLTPYLATITSWTWINRNKRKGKSLRYEGESERLRGQRRGRGLWDKVVQTNTVGIINIQWLLFFSISRICCFRIRLRWRFWCVVSLFYLFLPLSFRRSWRNYIGRVYRQSEMHQCTIIKLLATTAAVSPYSYTHSFLIESIVSTIIVRSTQISLIL